MPPEECYERKVRKNVHTCISIRHCILSVLCLNGRGFSLLVVSVMVNSGNGGGEGGGGCGPVLVMLYPATFLRGVNRMGRMCQLNFSIFVCDANTHTFCDYGATANNLLIIDPKV